MAVARPHVARFEADRVLNEKLRAASTIGGVPLAECRWWEDGNCLAIWQRRHTADGSITNEWMVRQPLVDGSAWPRQLRQDDIDDIVKTLHKARHSRGQLDVLMEMKRANDEADAKSLAQYHDDCDQVRKMANEMKRRGHCWHGVRGDVDCPTCQLGEKLVDEERSRKARVSRSNGVTVTDRRRFA